MNRKKKTVSPGNTEPAPVETLALTILTPMVMCPVAVEGWSCDAILELQPHPTLPGRVIAICNCTSAWSGQAVYETNEAPAHGDEVETLNKEESVHDSA